jgi:hypothetical protein
MLTQGQVNVFQWLLYITIWWACVGTLSDFGTLFQHNNTKRWPTPALNYKIYRWISNQLYDENTNQCSCYWTPVMSFVRQSNPSKHNILSDSLGNNLWQAKSDYKIIYSFLIYYPLFCVCRRRFGTPCWFHILGLWELMVDSLRPRRWKEEGIPNRWPTNAKQWIINKKTRNYHYDYGESLKSWVTTELSSGYIM